MEEQQANEETENEKEIQEFFKEAQIKADEYIKNYMNQIQKRDKGGHYAKK